MRLHLVIAAAFCAGVLPLHAALKVVSDFENGSAKVLALEQDSQTEVRAGRVLRKTD